MPDLTEPQTITHLHFASNGPTEIARRLIRMTNEIRRELRLKTVEDTHQRGLRNTNGWRGRAMSPPP
ncbi:MAG: hypothetical protein MK110_04705 [Fuerstiella sp.]|nr:hypothetical protein [Fuerstiella sp.]